MTPQTRTRADGSQYQVLAVNASRTTAGQFHEIRQDMATQTVRCTCRGFSSYKRCWHLDVYRSGSQTAVVGGRVRQVQSVDYQPAAGYISHGSVAPEVTRAIQLAQSSGRAVRAIILRD